MKRRDFFRNATIAAAGAAILSPVRSIGQTTSSIFPGSHKGKTAKNIIFMVSDGMSHGTLAMQNMMSEIKNGRLSHWMSLYSENKVSRGLMDTASANSLVTDSSAASSSWGGGFRVNNGAVNVTPDGVARKPILQKFKAAGKTVGCVTTVEITHATPSGFSVSSDSRSDQAGIAVQHLELGFDVLMGGGAEYFSADRRSDGRDLFSEFAGKGYKVAKTKGELLAIDKQTGREPILGIFSIGGLPYALDRENDPEVNISSPSLAEMTGAAIRRLNRNPNGFVMQVEGGKVDWAAHANDIGALLYDQEEFDDAVATAIAFAEADGETLVIITTDHGNANPGLFSDNRSRRNFDRTFTFKHSNNWVLQGIDRDFSAGKVIERLEHAQGIVINAVDAMRLLTHYVTDRNEDGLYNPYKLPFKDLAVIQEKHTSVGWGSMGHSGDHVEVAAFGPGKELLKPFVRNTDMHYLMLEAAAVPAKFR